ncbi:hypothetical protein WKI68_37945 [Streptomyces sp. MS1.HAVA.3]|uniref:Uncharacterized protein n=1 Tax=Streptomyces caledonius TaxID=3134107 RepID=A0ABU8UC20_9ACTN
MDVTVGTFNLNNLFSRFNFRAEVEAILPNEQDGELTSTYVFEDPRRCASAPTRGNW